MGKLGRFAIELEGFPDDSQGSYVAGGPVKGKVIIELTEDTVVKDVYIILRGKSEVYWRNRNSRTGGFHSGTEYYLHEKASLYSNKDSSKALPAGSHVFPFSFQLPRTIPSSYLESHEEGRITYKLEACYYNWKSTESTTKRRIWLTSPYDLKEFDDNAHEELKLQGGKEVSGEESVRSLCCKESKLTWKFQVANKIGYIPGETIKVHVSMRNPTSSPFTPKIKFTQVVELRADDIDGGRRRHETDLYHTTKNPVGPGEQVQYELNIDIPKDIIQSELRYCNLINVGYSVMLNIHSSMDLPVCEGQIPIIIGTEIFDCTDSSFTPVNLARMWSEKLSGGVNIINPRMIHIDDRV